MEPARQALPKGKWHYIALISEQSDRYGGLLVEMMEEYGVSSLRALTRDQAQDFWERLEARLIENLPITGDRKS
ncbi:MAG: hypothetical protein PHD67_03325 [Oscillospiraceae bacterium]|nr:hypothetical protein [Oscillospiraceae bacterium]